MSEEPQDDDATKQRYAIVGIVLVFAAAGVAMLGWPLFIAGVLAVAGCASILMSGVIGV